MAPARTLTRQPRLVPWLAVMAIAALAASLDTAHGWQSKLGILRIGTSGTLTVEGGKESEKSSLETLRSFIKEETALDNEIIRQADWKELAKKMSTGELQIGVFHGYEFGWAQAQYPELKPLAVAVNVYVYPVAYVVAGRDNPAKDFAGLQGQSLVTVSDGLGFLRLFLDRECRAAGKKPETFFSKITYRDNFEDVLDDVVDGAATAAAADRAALDAYKRRKPGRFSRLKPLARSEPFPPAVVANYGTELDADTLQKFRAGLLNASNKEKGRTMLTLFRLTGFQDPPDDFAKVVAATRAAYPPPSQAPREE